MATFFIDLIGGLKQSRETKVLAENFFSLAVLQALNYLLPLVTLPYLVRVLGPARYGLIAFAQAFITYFIILTDYGFILSATREISVHRQDSRAVSRIFSSVMAIKLALTVVGLSALCVIVAAVPKFRSDRLLYLFTFIWVVGHVLFPVWFFQGMERMKYITGMSILGKSIFTIAIFIFVRKGDDYLLVPLINSLGYLITGLASIWIVFARFGVRVRLPRIADIAYHIREGWHIFLSAVSTSFYLSTNIFILGIFCTTTVVGYYAAADKIIRALIQLFNPLFQAVYPYMAKVAAEARDRAVLSLRKLLAVTFPVSFIMSAGVFIFANQLVAIGLGPAFGGSVAIIRILSPLLVIVPFACILANLGLLPFKLDRSFSRAYVAGAAINIALLAFTLGIVRMQGAGAALSGLLTECIVTGMLYAALRKNDIKIIG